jgi:hypothetical protein
MPSSGRHILDITKKGPSRGRARGIMDQMFDDEPKKGNQKQRPQRLRSRRRRQRIIALCICLISGIGLVGGLGAVSHLEVFAVDSVSVNGAEKLPTESLVTAAKLRIRDEGFNLFSRENIFLYPKRDIEETLANDFPRIKEVSVARASMLAQAVILTVEERKAFALWCLDATCYSVDAAGFIFAPAGDTPETKYIFRGGIVPNSEVVGQYFLRGRIADTVALMRALETGGYKPQGITVDSEKDFSVQLEGGPNLLATFEMSRETLLKNLETALEAEKLRNRLSELQYIDLRFGNRVYYK